MMDRIFLTGETFGETFDYSDYVANNYAKHLENMEHYFSWRSSRTLTRFTLTRTTR